MGWSWRRNPPSYPEFPPLADRGAAPERSPDSNRPRPGAGDAFTPTRPKTGRRNVVGRERELQRILQGLQEDCAHVVLYSERGRGKTSLANMIVQSLRQSGTIVARHTCEAATTFDGLMRGLMLDLPSSLLAARSPDARASDQEGCSAALPAGPLRPLDIVSLPRRLDCTNLVCVVDEFDRVEDAATRTQLADLIKQLSDRAAPLLFLIVGVSDNLDQILGQHPSIQRTVIGVHLPLFTDHDVAVLISRAGQELGMSFPLDSVARIAVLARGMPYMVQLLGLRLTQAARSRGDTTVLKTDFIEAIARIIDDASPTVAALYADLTDNGRDAAMVAVLRQVARAPQDAWGRFMVLPGGDKVVVGDQSISALHWKRLLDARLLKPASVGSDLFVFAERGVMHHALLLALTAAERQLDPGAERLTEVQHSTPTLAQHAGFTAERTTQPAEERQAKPAQQPAIAELRAPPRAHRPALSVRR